MAHTPSLSISSSINEDSSPPFLQLQSSSSPSSPSAARSSFSHVPSYKFSASTSQLIPSSKDNSPQHPGHTAGSLFPSSTTIHLPPVIPPRSKLRRCRRSSLLNLSSSLPMSVSTPTHNSSPTSPQTPSSLLATPATATTIKANSETYFASASLAIQAKTSAEACLIASSAPAPGKLDMYMSSEEEASESAAEFSSSEYDESDDYSDSDTESVAADDVVNVYKPGTTTRHIKVLYTGKPILRTIVNKPSLRFSESQGAFDSDADSILSTRPTTSSASITTASNIATTTTTTTQANAPAHQWIPTSKSVSLLREAYWKHRPSDSLTSSASSIISSRYYDSSTSSRRNSIDSVTSCASNLTSSTKPLDATSSQSQPQQPLQSKSSSRSMGMRRAGDVKRKPSFLKIDPFAQKTAEAVDPPLSPHTSLLFKRKMAQTQDATADQEAKMPSVTATILESESEDTVTNTKAATATATTTSTLHRSASGEEVRAQGAFSVAKSRLLSFGRRKAHKASS